MTIFKNAESGINFVVDNIKGTITVLRKSELAALQRFSHMFGGIDILITPNYQTVIAFRKLVKTGILSAVSYADTSKVLMNCYPEYFI